MYARATDGNLPNNVKFSSCSKEAITRVLSVKAAQCFQQEKSYCGNKVNFLVKISRSIFLPLFDMFSNQSCVL